MPKMINADQALKALTEKHHGTNGFERYEDLSAMAAIDAMPDAVVRCKECVNATESKTNGMIVCREFELMMPEGFFCAAGRKAETDERDR